MDTLLSTWRLAWRNVWRNRRRTILTASAIGVGLISLLLMEGLTNGMQDQLEATVTRSWLGDAQIHRAGYREAPAAGLYIEDADALAAQAREIEGVRAVSRRIIATGLAAIGDRSAPIRLVGVDFEHEAQVTDWGAHLTAGRWPEQGRADRGDDRGGDRDVLIGASLARRLDVEAGSPLIVTAARVADGEQQGVRLRVAGLLSTGDPLMDKGTVVLSLARGRALLGLTRGAHQLALRIDPIHLRAALGALEGEGLDVADWRTLSPMVESMGKMQRRSMDMVLGIVGLILGLSVLNTLTMALMERLREFGILRALGTSPGRLALLIELEAFNLALIGVACGLAVGLPLCLYLGASGIGLSGRVQIGGVTLSSTLKLRLGPESYTIYGAAMIALSLAVAAIAAWRAGRIQPIEALRRE